ncbi:SCO family protein [Paenibacillus sp. 2RAB27]|uniref:SCO family protein n=1 Tax=Paenibacillus sp. 2RAB27 TaxID=3232991 RepID=UPI003F9D7491
MQETNRKVWLRSVTLVCIAAIVLCTVYWVQQGTNPLPKIKVAPEFSLQNLKGEQVKLSDTGGKVRLVEFFFANCTTICPVTTSNMVLMQNNLKEKKKFGKSVAFLSITFDPERDTPEALEKYASLLGIDQAAGWQLLRGNESDVIKTANDFGIMAVKQKDGQFAHSIRSLFLIDQEGMIRKIYDMGDSMDNKVIEKDIKKLSKSS